MSLNTKRLFNGLPRFETLLSESIKITTNFDVKLENND